MKIKTVISVSCLVVTLGIGAYLESPFSFWNKNYAYSADQPVMAQPVEIEQSSDIPELEEKLVDTKEDDGYILETYEEYEVYKDKDGRVIKSEPTGKTDTIKYWDYSKEDR